MGNPFADAAVKRAASITYFHTSNTWIEGSALDQAAQIASLPGMSHVMTFPDLHPGKYGPVGSAMLADRIYPQLIGNDIGCGMSLFRLDISARKLRLDKAAEQLRSLEGQADFDTGPLLEAAGLRTDLFPTQIGTIGGGNHFCELQAIVTLDGKLSGLDRDCAYLLVHSGSRAFGTEVFEAYDAGHEGLEAASATGLSYLEAHDQAVRWASLNRQVIALRAAHALRTDFELLTDAPHNLIEPYTGGLLHRKGAAKADLPLIPLAGSRDALSYLLTPGDNIAEALHSLAHGAGRKFDRRSMHGRVGASRSDRERLSRNANGGQIICEDRQLLIEEAPTAYKRPEQVVADLEAFKLARAVAAFKPLVTFKKSAPQDVQQSRFKFGRHGDAR